LSTSIKFHVFLQPIWDIAEHFPEKIDIVFSLIDEY